MANLPAKIARFSVALVFCLLSCKKVEVEMGTPEEDTSKTTEDAPAQEDIPETDPPATDDNFAQENLAITSLTSTEEPTGEGEGTGTGTGTIKEEFTLTEVVTLCHYGTNGMTLLIQTKADKKVEADKAIYFMTMLPELEVGKTIRIDQENPISQAAIFVRPSSTPLPKLSDTPVHYSTKQSQGSRTNRRPVSYCEFKIEKADKEGDTKGTMMCANLAQFDEVLNASLVVLGEILTISGNWQCDRYN